MKSLPIDSVIWFEPGRGIRAQGVIPQTMELFQDHFPSFPILPGVLAVEILKRTAECYLQKMENQPEAPLLFLKTTQRVKFSRFLKPGDQWESELTLMVQEGSETHWSGRLYQGNQVAVSAEMILQSMQGCEGLLTS
ncbi:MAG TPA: hypothetical protein VD913_02655 [bacterium]|nr:hypothetical protein [bacterium]